MNQNQDIILIMRRNVTEEINLNILIGWPNVPTRWKCPHMENVPETYVW